MKHEHPWGIEDPNCPACALWRKLINERMGKLRCEVDAVVHGK